MQELLGKNSDWHVKIIGTDINREALQKARQGQYRSWSFRSIDRTYMNQYFSQDGSWSIDPSIREAVRFEYLNLVEDSYPDYAKGIYDIDLILCRNVFIYFQDEGIEKVLNKFFHTLSPQGYLLTGHAEILGVKTEHYFHMDSYREGRIWKRGKPSFVKEQKASFCAERILSVAFKDSSLVKSVLDQNRTLSHRQKQESLRQEKESMLSREHREVSTDEDQEKRSLLEIAREKADRKKYAEALQDCQRHLKSHPFDARAYYLISLIYVEQGLEEEAIATLRKVLYLAPHYISAHIELGHLYINQGNLQKGRKVWIKAKEIILQEPTDLYYEGDERLEELLRKMKCLLGEG
ncbi:MCP methyltransferase, CheR-type [Heliorestis convoluta]|uniref:MCP methyltransferase, CheR-type n=2 Tax=Heliorestis convoluta TaxID=356322 RepID=A0A5Q2N0H6_9FIRM|nr:MCP methyltransferase, CheR-type [Heliorestis convoluta]